MDSQLLGLRTAHQNFLDYLKEKGRASATIVAYGADIRQLIKFCKKLNKNHVNDITKEELKAFKKHLGKQDYTAKSISRKINSIKTFFKFLNKQNKLTKNPASALTHPKYKTKPPRILSQMEYRALRDVCRYDERIYAIIELFLQTGIRISELANLRLEDVKDKKIIIRPKGSHPGRTIPLNKAAKNALEKYLQVRPDSKNNHIFITKTGRPFLVRNIRSTINRYFEKAGIEDATVNDLRHTFIAHQLKAGTPLTMVSKLVGHKRLSTTEKYLDLVKKKSSNGFELEEL